MDQKTNRCPPSRAAKSKAIVAMNTIYKTSKSKTILKSKNGVNKLLALVEEDSESVLVDKISKPFSSRNMMENGSADLRSALQLENKENFAAISNNKKNTAQIKTENATNAMESFAALSNNKKNSAQIKTENAANSMNNQIVQKLNPAASTVKPINGIIQLPQSPLISEKNKKPANYSFGMIETDDSTDDETDCVHKIDKRPPPPNWSLPVNRLNTIIDQTKIQNRHSAKFFGESSDVDLQEIFPQINKKHLQRRDSSFRWDTPPRYSILPKY